MDLFFGMMMMMMSCFFSGAKCYVSSRESNIS